MRYNLKELTKTFKEQNKDFYEYITEYVSEVEALGAKFIGVDIDTDQNDIFTNVYYFDIEDTFKQDIEVLTRDDDSQPNNTYTIFFGTLAIFELRFV